LIRTAYRMPEKHWNAFDLWAELPRKVSIPNLSIQVDLQHVKKRVWLRLEGALSAVDAERLGRKIRDSLAQSRNCLVLDLKKLHWDKVDDLQPLREKLLAYRSRIRLILPKLARVHPELMLLAGMFNSYKS
jgi:hypothetical protein